jgi:hypothetical protein
VVNTRYKPIAVKTGDNTCPAVGFLYPCAPVFFVKKKAALPVKNTGYNMAKSPARSPPLLKKRAVWYRGMNGYCGYGKNYTALPYLLVIALIISLTGYPLE